jgi:hypothetical protein
VEALRKRLERWRHENPDHWEELADRKPRQPKYVYREAAVLSVIAELRASS